MQSIADKVAIIGMGCTKFGENWDQSGEDMIVDAAYEAFEDAGVAPQDIQAAWVGTHSSGATGQVLSRPLKLQYIPITRVENACATAQDALRNACFAVAAGMYDVVLALGFEKLKDSGLSGLPVGPGTGRMDPGYDSLTSRRPCGRPVRRTNRPAFPTPSKRSAWPRCMIVSPLRNC